VLLVIHFTGAFLILSAPMLLILLVWIVTEVSTRDGKQLKIVCSCLVPVIGR